MGLLEHFRSRRHGSPEPAEPTSPIDSGHGKGGLAEKATAPGLDDVASLKDGEIATVSEVDLNPGELTFEEGGSEHCILEDSLVIS